MLPTIYACPKPVVCNVLCKVALKTHAGVPVDLDRFRFALENDPRVEGILLEHGVSRTPPSPPNVRQFNNSISLKLSEKDFRGRKFKRSLTLFGNGIISATGYRSTASCCKACRMLASILQATGVLQERSTPKLHGFRTTSITANTDFGTEVNLVRMYDRRLLLLKLDSVTGVEYDSMFHVGLILKIDGATIIVFGSGKVCFTGVRDMAALRDAHAMTINLSPSHRII